MFFLTFGGDDQALEHTVVFLAAFPAGLLNYFSQDDDRPPGWFGLMVGGRHPARPQKGKELFFLPARVKANPGGMAGRFGRRRSRGL